LASVRNGCTAAMCVSQRINTDMPKDHSSLYKPVINFITTKYVETINAVIYNVSCTYWGDTLTRLSLKICIEKSL